MAPATAAGVMVDLAIGATPLCGHATGEDDAAHHHSPLYPAARPGPGQRRPRPFGRPISVRPPPTSQSGMIKVAVGGARTLTLPGMMTTTQPIAPGMAASLTVRPVLVGAAVVRPDRRCGSR